jgi:hypothetical protein
VTTVSGATQYAKIAVKGLKVTTLVPPSVLSGLVPPEPQPAGNPTLDLEVEGGGLAVRAVLNGKSVRKILRLIAEHGADSVNVVLQGTMKPQNGREGRYLLEAAGLSATIKTPKPEAPAATDGPSPPRAARAARAALRL